MLLVKYLPLLTQAVQKAVGKPASGGGGGTKRARAPDDEDEEEEDGAAAARPEGAAVKKKPMGRPPKVWKCVRSVCFLIHRTIIVQ